MVYDVVSVAKQWCFVATYGFGDDQLQRNVRRYLVANLRKINKCSVKVEFTLEQATKAQMESRGIALLFL